MGPLGSDFKTIVGEIGKCLVNVSGAALSKAFIYQRLYWTKQRGKATLLRGTMILQDELEFL